MRIRWLESLVIALGLVALDSAGCKGPDGGTPGESGDGSSSSSGNPPSTTTGGGGTTTGDGDGDTSCIPGELACACNGGLCLGDLVCNDGLCSDPDCIPGELACECNDGLCLGDFVCIDGVCLEDGGTTGTTGTTAADSSTTDPGMECPNANEMMCDGACVDVIENAAHCGGCGNVCETSTDMTVGGCEAGQCLPYWSECFEPGDGFVTCEDVCQAEGKACVEEGCGTYTWLQNGVSICESGNTDGSATSQTECDFPIVWQGMLGRCCCL